MVTANQQEQGGRHGLSKTSSITQLIYNSFSSALEESSAYHVRRELEFLNNEGAEDPYPPNVADSSSRQHRVPPAKVNDLTLTSVPKGNPKEMKLLLEILESGKRKVDTLFLDLDKEALLSNFLFQIGSHLHII